MNLAKIWVWLVLGGLVCLAAENARALDLAVEGTYWAAADGQKDTWGAGAKLGIPLFTQHLELEGRAYWLQGSGDVRTGTVQFVPLDLGAAVHFLPDQFLNPFLAGGVSYIYATADQGNINGNVGAYAGAGLDMRIVGPLRLTAEALYRWAQLDFSDRFESSTWDASGLTLNAGVLFRF